MEQSYDVYKEARGVPVKAWTKGVPLEEMAARLVEWNGGTSETLQGRD